MKVFVAQIYIQAGVILPFSHAWQIWLGDQLSSLATPHAHFLKKYGSNFDLGIRISAQSELKNNQIRGPGVFKKYNNVEYTLFLPFDIIIQAEHGCYTAMNFVLSGVRDIFEAEMFSTIELELKRQSIIDYVCSHAEMLKKPWPSTTQ